MKEAIAKGKAKTDKIYKAAGECDWLIDGWKAAVDKKEKKRFDVSTRCNIPPPNSIKASQTKHKKSSLHTHFSLSIQWSEYSFILSLNSL